MQTSIEQYLKLTEKRKPSRQSEGRKFPIKKKICYYSLDEQNDGPTIRLLRQRFLLTQIQWNSDNTYIDYSYFPPIRTNFLVPEVDFLYFTPPIMPKKKPTLYKISSASRGSDRKTQPESVQSNF